LKSLSRSQWLKLSAVGLLGGSIPFLLFFYALQLTTAVNAGFLHKTLFLWASLFAFIFLREKIDKRFIAAALLLLAGNFLLFNISSFGFPEMLLLLATLFWAAESVLSKHVLRETSGSIVAFGRMFFGSVFILAFLALTNQTSQILALSLNQIHWVLITSAFLLAFVLTFYSGLKLLPVHKATAVLLLAQPITIFLSFAFLGTEVSLQQAFGFLLITAGLFLTVGFGIFLHSTKAKGLSIAAERN
jgi:drug/metabolite transporter (DMT)-like permease